MLQGFRPAGEGLGILLEKIEHARPAAYARVQFRVASWRIRTQLDKILGIVIESERFTNFLDVRNLLLRSEPRRKTAERMTYVDGGIMAGRSELAREDEVSIHEAA